ncbi:C39 family peptidase [Patescibacteria group bacterium]|nr:C39 family peptidase [Patescibacteria group bacterium]
MKRWIIIFFIFSLILSGGILYYTLNKRPPVETKFVQNVRDGEFEQPQVGSEQDVEYSTDEVIQEKRVEIKEPGMSAFLENNYHIYQTFNNCGPATLSMALAWYGVNVSQVELGNKMRPYQHPTGNNDDKTIFTHEFVDWANEYGIEGVSRVNGDIYLLKKFIANGFPVVVKTWLKQHEDIGHFRFVTGYDEEKDLVYFDDSYDGPNKKMKYFDFLSLWQPFNYNYIVLYPQDSELLVKEIIGQDWAEENAWKNALSRAEKENEKDPNNIYPIFNMSTSSYHLGDYERSVKEFEKVESRLPRRMLWYQIEPIRAYKELGDYDRVFKIIENILENGNRAFSELYIIRRNIYLEQGLGEKAMVEYELAKKYNVNIDEFGTNISNPWQ